MRTFLITLRKIDVLAQNVGVLGAILRLDRYDHVLCELQSAGGNGADSEFG